MNEICSVSKAILMSCFHRIREPLDEERQKVRQMKYKGAYALGENVKEAKPDWLGHVPSVPMSNLRHTGIVRERDKEALLHPPPRGTHTFF